MSSVAARETGSQESFLRRLQELKTEAQSALDRYLPAANEKPTLLHEAMRYACLGGGKRIRAILVYAAGQTLGVPMQMLHAPASAVEMIHAYSLVHDDLPCMDDDDLRRGQPTCHKAFDEATALLVGDALQALAFDILANTDATGLSDGQRLKMCATLAAASGSHGMAGGQAIDLAAVGQSLDLPTLEDMHRLKTGALIRASIQLGAIASNDLITQEVDALQNYAAGIGLAFQIRDDVLDVEGNTEILGKQQGADEALNKPTYPALLGLEQSKQRARRLCDEAIESLEIFDTKADFLRHLADFIVSRMN